MIFTISMQAPSTVAFILTSRLLGNLRTKPAPSFGPLLEIGFKIVPNDLSVAASFKDSSCDHSIRQVIITHINTISIQASWLL